MIETSVRVLLVAAVVALFVTPAVAMALPESGGSEAAETPDDAQVDNETIRPGEQLSGAVNVQGAEVNNAVESRSFGREVAAAASNQGKAAVVADRVERIEERLADLQEQRGELRTAFENGSLPSGAYQARMASLATRIDGIERQLNHSQRVTATLPEQARRAAGLNETKVTDLRSRASEMRGGEVAAAARAIGGPPPGKGMPASPGGGPPDGIPGGPNEPGPPDDAGPPGNMGPNNGSDRNDRATGQNGDAAASEDSDGDGRDDRGTSGTAAD